MVQGILREASPAAASCPRPWGRVRGGEAQRATFTTTACGPRMRLPGCLQTQATGRGPGTATPNTTSGPLVGGRVLQATPSEPPGFPRLQLLGTRWLGS